MKPWTRFLFPVLSFILIAGSVFLCGWGDFGYRNGDDWSPLHTPLRDYLADEESRLALRGGLFAGGMVAVPWLLWLLATKRKWGHPVTLRSIAGAACIVGIAIAIACSILVIQASSHH